MPNISEAKQAIYALKDKTKFERLIYSAAIFTELLQEHQIKPIIVGGLAVEIYSQNGYTTQDTDLVMDGSAIEFLIGDFSFDLNNRVRYCFGGVKSKKPLK